MKKYLALGGALVLTLALGTTALADSSRESKIKSQGVLEYQDNLGNTAKIDSSDLRLLANEIDVLEEWYREAVKEAWNDGYAAHVPGDAKIEYVYHEHTGSNGTGCYTKGRHVHRNCPGGTVQCGPISWSGEYGTCAGCGKRATAATFNNGGGSEHGVYKNTCNNQPINTWELGCGKTAGVTIEEAHIIYP